MSGFTQQRLRGQQIGGCGRAYFLRRLKIMQASYWARAGCWAKPRGVRPKLGKSKTVWSAADLGRERGEGFSN